MAAVCSRDHRAMTASPDAFVDQTYHVGVQHMGHGIPPLLLGNCPECATTLALELCDCRSSARLGEIETSPRVCVSCLNSLSTAAVFSPRPSPNEDDRRISR